jgi:lipopolysaccharide export LptBFGC system permease protein LptF
MVYGTLPLIALFIAIERFVGAGVAGTLFVVLALLLPFVALIWLGYQHFRHRKNR